MSRLIISYFKVIIIAIVMVMLCDIGSYLWNVYALNNELQNIILPMQKDITENNYLPEADYNMFKNMADIIQKRMNGGKSATDSDAFIKSMQWNYYTDSSYVGKDLDDILKSSNGRLRRRMGIVAQYGDVIVIELTVVVGAPVWFFASGSKNASSVQKTTSDITLTYTYLVPCLRYVV